MDLVKYQYTNLLMLFIRGPNIDVKTISTSLFVPAKFKETPCPEIVNISGPRKVLEKEYRKQ